MYLMIMITLSVTVVSSHMQRIPSWRGNVWDASPTLSFSTSYFYKRSIGSAFWQVYIKEHVYTVIFMITYFWYTNSGNNFYKRWKSFSFSFLLTSSYSSLTWTSHPTSHHSSQVTTTTRPLTTNEKNIPTNTFSRHQHRYKGYGLVIILRQMFLTGCVCSSRRKVTGAKPGKGRSFAEESVRVSSDEHDDP